MQQNARILARAIKHGVVSPRLEELELASNVGFLRVGMPDRSTPWWRSLLGWLRLLPR